MAKLTANITMSLDGYVTGPNDRPGQGLGVGGERLHYWVFGGPWTYESGPRGEMSGADKEFYDELTANVGAVIGGRGTYEAADAWGGRSPVPLPFFILTHRLEDEPPGAGFTFVSGLETAIVRARAAADGKDVNIVGGADVIRQALRAGHVDELSISIAPITLGAGKRLFDGFETTLALEPVRFLQSPFATHVTYRVVRYGHASATGAADAGAGNGRIVDPGEDS